MPACRSCSAEFPPESRYCNVCGTPVPSAADASTEVVFDSGSLWATAAMPAPADEGRFPPGTLVAARYRIAGLVGRGGMGEVYRATDLVLRQTVALKFLPPALAADRRVLDRFFNEVRVARQVSHPNVCRIHDIGETDGQPYLSMEYVDGEDLASLLRRIGRLAPDKAIEIARGVCAGLAAAHEKGVLHRDLKPSNIMLDGAGRARIMDFGLAGWAGQFEGSEIRSGTPGYMSPEQLAGREVTTRSDIYSLGVVLYELFTGRKAFEANSIAELTKLQARATPTSPVTVVKDLDPAVERVILRCLEPDPARRPASALAVAAALPGGDPLAAALAAGETPSPELVAAAGEASEMVRPRTALALLVIFLAGLLGAAAIWGRITLLSRVPFDDPPEALAGRARDILASLGYAEKPADSARGIDYAIDYLKWLGRNGPAPNPWSALASGRPSAVHFWYRTSPVHLEPVAFFSDLPVPGIVTARDPPANTAGMIHVELDTLGRLHRLAVVTPQSESPPRRPAPYDWKPLLVAAGLDPAALSQAEPEWLPQASWDTRAAWTGTWPGCPPGSLRVEAAAFRGRPVYFNLIGPWTTPAASVERPMRPGRRASQSLALVMFLCAALWACVMARRNVRLGRGDLRGAGRVAAAAFGFVLLGWALTASHVPVLYELAMLVAGLSWALFVAAVSWLLYMALEPYARKLWPHTLISWSRMLAGGLGDPLLGRDVLYGCVAGLAMGLALYLRLALAPRFGDLPAFFTSDALLGLRYVAGIFVIQVALSVAASLLTLYLMLGLRTLLRRQWVAAAVALILLSAIRVLASHVPALDAVIFPLMYGIGLFTLLRYGLIAFVTGTFVADALLSMPLTLDPSSWYIGYSVFALAVLAALAIHAFRAALAGRPVFFHD